MIGKLMSEAAHSIIGMLSARSGAMESTASNSDFGSLLLSSDNQPKHGAGETEFDISDIENVDAGDIDEDTDAVPAQPWEMLNVLPLAHQGLGGEILRHERSSPENGQNKTASAPVDPDTSAAKLALTTDRSTFDRDALQNLRSTPFAADGEHRQDTAKLASDSLSPDMLTQQNKLIRSGSSSIDIAQNTADADLADGKPFHDATSRLELNKQAAASVHLGTKAGEPKDSPSELDMLGHRASLRSNAPVATTRLQQLAMTDIESFKSENLEVQPATKSLGQSMEPLPVVNPSAQLAAREAVQKPATFDMSAPQVAERLGAEIAEISVNGGSKKFEINPRNLGRMEIILNTRGSADVIEIQTEHQATKHIIAQHSQALQDILKSQGRDDLTLRLEVKDNIFSSSNPDGGNLSRQENGGGREQQARPSEHRQTAQSLDGALENSSASDSSRYA